MGCCLGLTWKVSRSLDQWLSGTGSERKCSAVCASLRRLFACRFDGSWRDQESCFLLLFKWESCLDHHSPRFCWLGFGQNSCIALLNLWDRFQLSSKCLKSRMRLSEWCICCSGCWADLVFWVAGCSCATFSGFSCRCLAVSLSTKQSARL